MSYTFLFAPCMSSLLVLPHLGTGDQLICNGLVRHFSADRPCVLLVCKRVSAVTVAFMYRDLHNVRLLVVEDDSSISPNFGADPAVLTGLQAAGFELLLLGMHRGPLAPGSGFADQFYDQAGISRQVRYTGFHVLRDSGLEARFRVEQLGYRFVHDDVSRGYTLRLQGDEHNVHPGVADDRPGSDNIFAFAGLMEKADEIVVIDSCYAHMADLLNLCPGRRRLHCYAKNPQDRCDELYRQPGWHFVW